jgi:hypothetical protein
LIRSIAAASCSTSVSFISMSIGIAISTIFVSLLLTFTTV